MPFVGSLQRAWPPVTLTLTLTIASVACTNAPGEGLTGAAESDIVRGGYTEPTLDASERAAVLAKFKHVDPEHVAPADLLEDAILFAQANEARLKRPDVVSVIDFSRHSREERLFVVNLESGTVEPHVVAHGSGSDPRQTGIPSRFSNVPGSNASSLGYYVTAETFNGKHGLSLRIDGVSDTNYNARARAVIVHGASYVHEGSPQQGRSWGCPAVPDGVSRSIIQKIANGSVLYIGLSKGGTRTDTPSKPTPPTACVPKTAAELCNKEKSTRGLECGAISDGCGGSVNCSDVADFGCGATETCNTQNKCEPGTPPPVKPDPVKEPPPSEPSTSTKSKDDGDDDSDKEDNGDAAKSKPSAQPDAPIGSPSSGCSAAPSSHGSGGFVALLAIFSVLGFARGQRRLKKGAPRNSSL